MDEKISKQLNKLSIIIFDDYSYVFGMYNFVDKPQELYLIEIGLQARLSIVNQQYDWGKIDYSKHGKKITKAIKNVIAINELDDLINFAEFFKKQNKKSLI